MKCGRSLGKKAINNGFGWLLIRRPGKSLASILGAGIGRAQKVCGGHYLLYIGNVPCAIQIFGHHMRRFSRKRDIDKLVKNAEKQIISNGLIVPCAKGSHVWLGKHYRSQKSSKTISAPSNISSVTTISQEPQHYQFSTTRCRADSRTTAGSNSRWVNTSM